MKKFFVLLAVMLMSSTMSFAQTELELLKEKAELNKAYGFKDKASSEAKKQAKEMKKEGWKVNAGDRSLEMQIQSGIDLKKRIMKSADGRIVEKFFILSGRQTAQSFNTAYTGARAQAQAEIASAIKAKISQIIKRKQDNQQLSSIDAVTVDKFNARTAIMVEECLTNTNQVLCAYRELSNRSFDVQVRIAFDKEELIAKMKRQIRETLEAEGDKMLETVVDEAFADDFE